MMSLADKAELIEAFVAVLNFSLDNFRQEIRAAQEQQTLELKRHIDMAAARRASTKGKQ